MPTTPDREFEDPDHEDGDDLVRDADEDNTEEEEEGEDGD